MEMGKKIKMKWGSGGGTSNGAPTAACGETPPMSIIVESGGSQEEVEISIPRDVTFYLDKVHVKKQGSGIIRKLFTYVEVVELVRRYENGEAVSSEREKEKIKLLKKNGAIVEGTGAVSLNSDYKAFMDKAKEMDAKNIASKSYVVESILDHQIENTSWKFLVFWKHFPKEEASWEPYRNLKHLRILKEYCETHVISPSPLVASAGVGSGEEISLVASAGVGSGEEISNGAPTAAYSEVNMQGVGLGLGSVGWCCACSHDFKSIFNLLRHKNRKHNFEPEPEHEPEHEPKAKSARRKSRRNK